MSATTFDPDNATTLAGFPPAPEALQLAGPEGREELGCTATYSPDDNKLRISSTHRLDAAIVERLSAAGFRWAPKQRLWVAAMWTPERADLCEELAGEITDDDTSLVDRAEERAERFGSYSDRRASESLRAADAVRQLADGIPFGQPILVGHHSEARARRDAKRIQNGMRRAVDLWDTSEYWKRRAHGAVRAAKYKERPDVRARRIRGIEADARKVEREIDECQALARLWAKVPRYEYDRQTEVARAIAGRTPSVYLPARPGKNWSSTLYGELADHNMHGDTAYRLAVASFEARLPRLYRWRDHYAFRLEYERAMLAEAGGLAVEREGVDLAVGGEVLIGETWLTVLRINRKDGKPVSITTNGRYGRVRGVEEVKDYRAPSDERAALVKAATTKPPLCNYNGPGFTVTTAEAYKKRHSDYKGTLIAGAVRGALGVTLPLQEGDAPHRVRSWLQGHCLVPVFIEDMKETRPPKAGAVAARPVLPPPTPASMLSAPVAVSPRQAVPPAISGIRQSLAVGVQAVAAPQLFPTPASIAQRMVSLAAPQPGMRVLEPSAGTGALLDALAAVVPLTSVRVQAYEVNQALSDRLARTFPDVTVTCADFLSLASVPQAFDLVLMNPPFVDAADLKHITHARSMLKPGGLLVGICAGGPRQAQALQSHAQIWEPLEAGTFAGTNAAAVLFALRA